MIKKLINLLLVFSIGLTAQIAIRHNNISVGNPWTERYVINSPFNGIGSSVVVDYTKDSTYMRYFFPQFYYPRYAQTISSLPPESILSIRNGDGLLVRHAVNHYSKGKSDSTYMKKDSIITYNEGWGITKYGTTYSKSFKVDTSMLMTVSNVTNSINSINSNIDTKLSITDTLKYNHRINSKFDSPIGTISQYIRGDGALSTFPTTNSSFSNSEGYLKTVDTLSYSNRLNSKLNKADTIIYNHRFISKLNKSDTLVYNNRINNKLSIIDTLKYDHRFTAKLNKSDTLQYNARIVDKQTKLSGIGFVKINGSTISYDNSTYLTTEVDGSITNEIELPTQTGQSGKVLSTNGTTPSWVTNVVGTVTNVSSSTSELTVANQSTTPIITIVSSPKLTTSRTINMISFDGSSNINTGVKTFQGTTQRNGAFPVFKTVTVSSGTAIFHLTDDGLSTGIALFSNGVIPESINAFVSDATASYQMGYAFSNSNKTLTITVNKLTTANILTGILGQTQANGSTVTLQIWGY